MTLAGEGARLTPPPAHEPQPAISPTPSPGEIAVPGVVPYLAAIAIDVEQADHLTGAQGINRIAATEGIPVPGYLQLPAPG